MFEVLPRCVLGYLADFCPPSDLFALSATCRHLRPLSQRPEVYQVSFWLSFLKHETDEKGLQWLKAKRDSAPIGRVWNFVTGNGRQRNKHLRNGPISKTHVQLIRDGQEMKEMEGNTKLLRPDGKIGMLTLVKRDGQLTGAVVRYHGHEVVALTHGPGGDEIVFNTHGYRTQSTFRVMEWFCELCGIPLFFKREKWQWLMKRTVTPPNPARMHWLVKQQDPLQIIHNFGGSGDDKGQGQRGPGDVTDSDLFVYSLVNPPEPLSQQRGGKRLKTA